MTANKAASKSHYMKLIGKEDFNASKTPHQVGVLETEYFRIEAHNLDGGYDFGFESFDVEAYDKEEYIEGQLEGNAIKCRGDHFSEGDPGELRVILKPDNVHWLRFYVSPLRFETISRFEFYEPAGNLLKRIDGRSGWVDFKIPLQDMNSASIARVSVYFEITFGSPVVDTFELGQWTEYRES